MAEPRVKKVASARDQVVGYYKRKIDSGAIPHDAQLPGKPAMMHAFGVSSNTIAKARRELVAAGYIRVDHGRGIYAVGPAHRRPDTEDAPADPVPTAA